jgi:hypothetical protein
MSNSTVAVVCFPVAFPATNFLVVGQRRDRLWYDSDFHAKTLGDSASGRLGARP